MKKIILAFLVATHAVVTAAPTPPQPQTVPPPVGLSVGSEIWVLLIVAILFSFFKLKPFFKHKKTPM